MRAGSVTRAAGDAGGGGVGVLTFMVQRVEASRAAKGRRAAVGNVGRGVKVKSGAVGRDSQL
jgi:hypothetical protein